MSTFSSQSLSRFLAAIEDAANLEAHVCYAGVLLLSSMGSSGSGEYCQWSSGTRVEVCYKTRRRELSAGELKFWAGDAALYVLLDSTGKQCSIDNGAASPFFGKPKP